jgi:predicted metal-dependent hydrolase
MTYELKVEVIREKRRTLSLHIQPDASVLVKAPLLTPDRFIQNFLNSNHDWIQKRLEKKKQNLHRINHTYQEGEEFIYLGKTVKLTYGPNKVISVEEDILLFPEFLKFRVKQELTDWYIKKGKEIITRRLEWYATDLHASYTGLTFSDTKSKWGSCSFDNQLQFNWRLVMAPILVINYVVVHELVHTIEKNHSARFWSKVGHYNPSYKQQRAWLKEYGDILVV